MNLAQLLLVPDIHEYSILQGPIGVMAIHGGNIERGTEQLANYIARNSHASLYVISPRTQKRDWKYHISSNKINPQESKLLTEFLAHVRTAISIHGHVIKKTVLCIGGLNHTLRKTIIHSLKDSFEVVDALEEGGICKNLAGRNERNVVNLPPEKGVQIEIPLMLRKGFEHRPYETMPSPETRVLAESLIRTIRDSWQSFEP
jgi:phage replication-related protein YjqB (UPF0714/DUF867 family)